MTKRMHLFVSGRVQGVGFRFFVNALALKLNLKGWVRNADSRVEIDVEGPVEMLEEFKVRLNSDKPQMAVVENLRVKELPIEGFSDFRIEETV